MRPLRERLWEKVAVAGAAAEVIAIREYAGPLSQRKLAAKYGVSQQQVSLIRRHQRWAHLSDPY